MTALYYIANQMYYGKQNAFYYSTPAVFAALSAQAIIRDCGTLTGLVLLLATPLLLDHSLPLFLHFLLHATINVSEGKSYSTITLLCAEIGCLAFSSLETTWYFLLAGTVVALITQISALQGSKLGT